MVDVQHRVFVASLLLDKKPVVTAVAVDHDGSRAFLGLEQGILEEYTLTHVEDGIKASLTARKPIVFKHQILSINPATLANCLAILTGDGALRFVHSDTFEGHVVHKGPVFATAVSSVVDHRPLIAIGVRSGISRNLRVLVFKILAAGGRVAEWQPCWEVDLPVAPSHVRMAWAGTSLIVGNASEYYLTWAPHGQSGGKGRWREVVGVGEGGDVGLASLPRQACAVMIAGPVGVVVNGSGDPVGNSLNLEGMPRVKALAAGDGYVAMVFEDGVRIFDPEFGHMMQYLTFGEDNIPAPGQPIRAVGGETPASSVILVAGRHKVWALGSVPPWQQMRDLLEQRNYVAAEKLAVEGAAKGYVWAEEGRAQAALLQLHDCRFSEALALLEQCSPSVFQPTELFPLFPEYMQDWKQPQSRPHWGIHPPIRPLNAMVSQNTSTAVQVVAEAKGAVTHYLFRARELPGVECLDGIDTLIVHLLIDLRWSAQAAAFAAAPNRAVPVAVMRHLKAVGWHHALASLWATRGEPEFALETWREMVNSGDAGDDGTTDSKLAERLEVLTSVSALLASSSLCSVPTALNYLPWLINVAPEAAGDVVCGRDDLDSAVVLGLVEQNSPIQLRYLTHMVDIRHSQDADIHTLLAESLINAIIVLNPSLKSQVPNASQYSLRRQSTTALVGSGSPISGIASLVSGGASDSDIGDKNAVLKLRLRLLRHLEGSTLWDRKTVLTALEGSSLYEELVIVAWKVGNHLQALRTLAITLHNVGSAVQYAAAYLPPAEHRTLLQLLLDPGDDIEPRWEDACRVVALLGASLNPLEVVNAAPSDMPVAAALGLVSPLIRERIHRRRSGQISAGLRRSQAITAASCRVSVEEQRIVIDENRACPDCRLRMGDKVFVVLPSVLAEDNRVVHGQKQKPQPTVVCLSCWNRRKKS